MNAQPTSEWLTAQEAAAYLKVKPRTLLAWAKTGKIPAHKLSGTMRSTWRFQRSELDAALNAAVNNYGS
jgi:excisionase family DNA binding protein